MLPQFNFALMVNAFNTFEHKMTNIRHTIAEFLLFASRDLQQLQQLQGATGQRTFGTFSHFPVFPDFSTASQMNCVSNASRKVGLAGWPLSMPWRKSAT